MERCTREEKEAAGGGGGGGGKGEVVAEQLQLQSVLILGLAGSVVNHNMHVCPLPSSMGTDT